MKQPVIDLNAALNLCGVALAMGHANGMAATAQVGYVEHAECSSGRGFTQAYREQRGSAGAWLRRLTD
ncbi:hypothetical protein HVA01_08580 [Halovibrio variabilis]|uniref:Uncharacterized protein n=1 Tax=Halovibrio variabilis TaxID=31910 RepID=A0A511UPZ0_9GAMM|nr:hypothetical protein HVA01_08580 [Halovibrio variabilis]